MRQFVGQRLLLVTPALAPIVDRVVIASQRGAIDTIGHIAYVTASITSDSLGHYIHSRQSCPPSRPSLEASSSTSGTSSDEAYRAVGLLVPGDVHALSGHHMHMDLALYFLEDLLQSISYISDTQGMLVHLVMDAIRHHQSLVVPQA